MLKQRKSNLELLRIAAMLVIVVSHFATHSSARQLSSSLLDSIILDCLSLGNLGVDLFVLISGYFVSVSGFRASTLFRTLGKTYIYGIMLALFSWGILGSSFLACVRSLLPESIGTQNWFVAPYLFMYLLSPVFNRLIDGMSRNGFKRLLIISTISFSILPGLLKIDFMSSRFIWFCYLYFVAAYYRLYGVSVIDRYDRQICMGSLCVGLGLTVLLRFIAVGVPVISDKTTIFLGLYSPFLLSAAVSLLSIFSKFEIQNSFVNKLSSATFGVYLIHDNVLLRQLVWSPVSLMPRSVIALGLLYSLFVYLVCTCIDLLTAFVSRRVIKTKSAAAGKMDKLYSRIDNYLSLG